MHYAEYVVLVLVLLCLTSVLSVTGSESFTVVKFVVQRKPQAAETEVDCYLWEWHTFLLPCDMYLYVCLSDINDLTSHIQDL